MKHGVGEAVAEVWRNPGRERFSAPGLIEPRNHGADPGVFRPHAAAESPSSAPVPVFRDKRVPKGCPEDVPSGAIRSTPWGESLHPPASPGANRSSVWSIFPDWCSKFPIGAFGRLARDLHMSWGMSRAARPVATSHKGNEGDRSRAAAP